MNNLRPLWHVMNKAVLWSLDLIVRKSKVYDRCKGRIQSKDMNYIQIVKRPQGHSHQSEFVKESKIYISNSNWPLMQIKAFKISHKGWPGEKSYNLRRIYRAKLTILHLFLGAPRVVYQSRGVLGVQTASNF